MVVPLAIGCNGHFSKVTRSKLKKLIQPVFIQLVCRTLTQIMVVLLYQIIVVLDVSLKSIVVNERIYSNWVYTVSCSYSLLR